MSRSPNLNVPQAAPPASRSGLSGLLFVLILIVLVVQILSFFVTPGRRESLQRAIHHDALPPLEQLKEVAVNLENKNISSEAADMWEHYLQMAELTNFEIGNIRYRIGKLRQDAGEYEKAYLQYALAEKLLGDSAPDLAHDIKMRRIECLRRRGQYADLAREIAERAVDDPQAPLEGQQIVAEVGGEKITVADFDRMLTNEIELAVKSRMGLSAEEEDALRKRAHEQFADPKLRAQQLQQIVATRVLADEARKLDIHQSPEFRERLMAVTDGILSSTLLFEEVSKRATVTDDDVKRFYAANKERYDQPPATFIAHILAKSEAHARDLISRIEDGASFEDLAKAESQDASTREKMGIITAPVPAEGEYVPMFGDQPELHDLIRESEAGGILSQPYQSKQGWHVIKIVSHRERIERPFEEIRDEVRRDTAMARKREVTEQYINELFEEHSVKLYPQVFVQQAEVPADQTTDATP